MFVFVVVPFFLFFIVSLFRSGSKNILGPSSKNILGASSRIFLLDFWPDAGRMLAGCRPDAGWMPAGCRPDIGFQFGFGFELVRFLTGSVSYQFDFAVSVLVSTLHVYFWFIKTKGDRAFWIPFIEC